MHEELLQPKGEKLSLRKLLALAEHFIIFFGEFFLLIYPVELL